MSIEGLAMGMRKGPLTKAEVPARVNHAQNKGVSQQCHFNSAGVYHRVSQGGTQE